MVLASAFFCPSEHFSAQMGRKVLPSAFFCFDKTAPKLFPSIMEEVEQNAVLKKHVGDYELGEFATVHRARHVKSGLEYAVKIIDKQQM